MKLAVYASQFRSREIAERALAFISLCSARHVDLTLARETVEAFGEYDIEVVNGSTKVVNTALDVADKYDFVVSLGGDGTFLRAAHWNSECAFPIVGVNLGHLGYLTSFSLEELDVLLQRLLTGDYEIETRGMLAVTVDENRIIGTDDVWFTALNEVAVLKQDTSSMISIPVKINGRTLGTYHADGLIVATPTGSTAYNLSVGGPVLQPTVRALTLSPIADHSLTMRPLVIDDEVVLEITALGRTSSYRVSLDGKSFLLPAGCKITVMKAPYKCKVVCRNERIFASTLRAKLLWGESYGER